MVKNTPLFGLIIKSEYYEEILGFYDTGLFFKKPVYNNHCCFCELIF